ncbi:MAG: MFS transporter [candidate division Zixibacteria bacterium]
MADLEHISNKRKYRLLFVTALSAFIGTLDASIVNISLPTLSRSFGISIDYVAWVVLAYSLTIASTLLFVGRIAVKKGFRYTYLTGFGLFTIGSCLCGMSVTIWQLIAFRIIHGVGASFMMAAGPALITRAFPVEERGKSMGILATVVGIGLMSGPPVGGLIVSTLGWKWIFFINIPIGIFGYIYSMSTLRGMKPDDPDTKLDIPGGLLQAAAIILILLTLNRLNDPIWTSNTLILMVSLGIFSFALFIIRETRVDSPLVGLGIFRYRQFSLAITSMMVSFICIAAWMILIPFYLEDILRYSPRQVGMVLVTVPLVTVFVAPLAGRISDKIGYRLLTTLGLCISTVGIFLISTLDQNSTRFEIIIRLIVIGIGGGMFQAPNSSAMMSAIPKRISAIASSLLAVARTLGLALGVAISTAIFTYRVQNQSEILDKATAYEKSFTWVVMLFAIVSILAIIISAFRKNRIDQRNLELDH